MSRKMMPLLPIAFLVVFAISCGTLDLQLENPKSATLVMPNASTSSTTNGKGSSVSTGSSISTPGASLPTIAPSANVHASAKTMLNIPGWHIAYSPDGKWLILGERKIHFLDAHSLKEVRFFQADRWVEGVAISPDSKTLAAIDESRGVMLFDMASGSELRTLPRSNISTSAASSSFLAFSPDSATLAVVLGDVVKLFNVASGDETGTIVANIDKNMTLPPHSIVFSPDGKLLYAGGWGGTGAWDVANGTLQTTFGKSMNGTNRIALSPDGKALVSDGPSDGSLILWEAKTGRQLRTFAGSTGGINGLAFSPDGLLLASACSDTTVKLWDVATGSLLQTLVGLSSPPSSVSFSPDGTALIAGTLQEGEQADVRIWTIENGPAKPTATSSSPASNTGAYKRPTFIPLSSLAISAGNAAQVKKISILDVSESGSLIWSPDGKWLVIGGRKIHFFHTPSFKETNSLDVEMQAFAISPDSRILAAAGYQGVKLLDLTSGSELLTLPRTRISTSALSNTFLAFTPDSATLAIIIGDVVKLFNVASGEEKATIVANGAFHIAISPDGTTMYDVGWGQQISVWDLASGQKTRTIGNSSISINNMILSPDGKILATAGFDGTIIFWEAATGRQLRTIANHQPSNCDLAFSPDGKVLAAVADNVTVKLWNAETGDLLNTLIGHSNGITNIAFSADGATLASSSYADGVYLWGLLAK
jgi:WD40 repeat protein